MRGTAHNPTTDQTRVAKPAFVRARRRAIAALAAGLVGVWIATPLNLPAPWWFAGAGVAAALGVLVPARLWSLPALAAVLLAMGGWAQARLNEPRPDRADRLIADGALARATGVVRTTPRPTDRPSGPGAPGAWREDTAWFELGVDSVGEPAVPATGVLFIAVPADGFSPLRPGDRVELRGVFRRPSAPTNPGEPDWTRHANQHARAGTLSVPAGDLIEPSDDPPGWASRLVRHRDALRARAASALGDDPVLRALVLGQRDRAFESSYRVFQRAGVAHVLAVSGFHLALLAGMGVLLVRVCGEHGRLETLAALIAIGAMLWLVPANAPVVRAGVLALAVLGADVAGRRWDRLSVLAWAAMGLLIWRPLDAFGLGYGLSVGITALLLAMAERDRAERWALLERHRAGGWRAAVRRVGQAFRVNACCWLVGTPVIAAATGVVSVVAPVAAVLIVPLAAVLLGVGWLQAILGLISPDLAAATAPVPLVLSRACSAAAAWFDALPFSSVAVRVGWAWAGVATACAAWWVLRRDHRRRSTPALALCAAWLIGSTAWSGRVDGLRIDTLDVGDGTAMLVRSGRDAMWWDCGSLHRDVGDLAADAARALGATRVRTAVITHANLDHFNALLRAGEATGLREVLVTPALGAARNGPWAATRDLLESRGVRVRTVAAGDTFTLGRARAEVLWSGADDQPRWLGNDGSMVLRLTVDTDAGERSVLLTGDIQTAGVVGLRAARPELRADIVEAPHHGSANAAAAELVGSLGATVVLQSSGRSRVNLDAWRPVRESSLWLGTAEVGAVYAHIRPDGSIDAGPSR